MTARSLADYMAASETAKRTIVRNSKYQPIARVIHHDEARLSIGRFLQNGAGDTARLAEDAQRLRDGLTDTDFDRDLLDHNADYINRFASVLPKIQFPDAELQPVGDPPEITLHGLKVTVELAARLMRLTKTNKVRIGGIMLRYAKNRALAPQTGAWQSAFLFGYLNLVSRDDAAEPEYKLCLTLDAYAGVGHPAPTDSVRRFHNMEAACSTIAERWPNIAPPPNAVF